jgi:hypothetical protein
MGFCAAIKPDGVRCKARAMKSSEWCFNHNPDYSDQRRRNASKGGMHGGRGRPAKSGAEGLKDIKDLLKSLTDDVLSGEVERATAIAANQLLNTALRAIELERRWKEIEDLEGRLEALEGVLKARRLGDETKRTRQALR